MAEFLIIVTGVSIQKAAALFYNRAKICLYFVLKISLEMREELKTKSQKKRLSDCRHQW